MEGQNEHTHSIGAAIAELRKSKGWTQAELAQKISVSDKAISKWEKDVGTPSVNFFPILAELFGVSIDYITTGQAVEKDMVDELIVLRDVAILGMVLAVGVAFVQIAVAAVSAAVIVLAVVGIVKKRTLLSVRLFLLIVAVLSGVGLGLTMLSSLLVPGGAALALALISTISYFAACAARVFTAGGSIKTWASNAAAAVVTMVAVFLLTGNILKTVCCVSAGSAGLSTGTIAAPVGQATEGLLYFTDLNNSKRLGTVFSSASVVGGVMCTLFAVGGFSALYTALLRALSGLYKGGAKDKWVLPLLIGAAMLVLFTVVPPIVGAAGEPPEPWSGEFGENGKGVLFKYRATLPGYFAMGMAAVAACAVVVRMIVRRTRRARAA